MCKDTDKTPRAISDIISSMEASMNMIPNSTTDSLPGPVLYMVTVENPSTVATINLYLSESLNGMMNNDDQVHGEDVDQGDGMPCCTFQDRSHSLSARKSRIGASLLAHRISQHARG